MKSRPFVLWTLLTLLYALSKGAAADDLPALRTLESQHLTLVTDLPLDAEVDSLPGYFDQAFDQWCEYFSVDPAAHHEWRVRGYLMQSPERFRAAGLLPASLPEFATGYSLGDQFWLHEQTSVYYRRQLMLHEGTHAFMIAMLGGTGPAWYAEGLAELLGTHSLEDGRITLNVIPRHRDDVPKWGRVEVVQTDFARRHALTLAKGISARRHVARHGRALWLVLGGGGVSGKPPALSRPLSGTTGRRQATGLCRSRGCNLRRRPRSPGRRLASFRGQPRLWIRLCADGL